MPKSLLLVLAFTSALAAEPRRYIVELRPAAGKRIAAAFRADAAGIASVRHEFSRVFSGAAVELREGQSVEALRRLPNVVAVHPDGEVVAFSGSAAGNSASARQRIVTSASGSGIVVAVIDTGIDGTHPALAGKVIGGYDFVNEDEDPMDDHGHGTHVAGIIAAQGDVMTGVAPAAKLLAYKVLDREGRGTTSGVIAAIERAVDPNADGDPADRADIINLSLGDRGHPDDPLSRAVDNAVVAGVVVCAAAGNDGAFHRIGSPAGAARAITVGASEVEDGQTVVAYFSSRGPATRSGAIKPDLVAPGHDILSTHLHHGYATLSGTSMASPYVAGLAALLLEEHPGWTPDRVKSALATTAQPAAGEEVMTQGTGFAHLPSARANTLVASPTQVNFGLDGSTDSSWSSTRRVTLRNDGPTSRTVHASLDGATNAIALTISPESATLAPGASAELDVTVTVDNTKLPPPQTDSFAFGGFLRLQSDAEVVRVPWAFVRAGRATLTSDAPASVIWYSDAPRRVSPVSIGANGLELLTLPGAMDFVITSVEDDQLRVFVAEEQQVVGDVLVNVTREDAPHEIRFAASGAFGTPFPDGDGVRTLRSLLLRVVLPDGRTLPLPDIAGRIVRTSPFTARYALLGIESFVERDAGRVHVAQHAPLRAVQDDRVLVTSPGDYASQDVTLYFPAGPRREARILPRDVPRRPNEQRLEPKSLRFAVDAPVWNATLFLTKEVHEDVAGGVQLSLHTDAVAEMPATLMTPTIRRDGDGFFATWGYERSGLPVHAEPGETMAFGRGAIHVPLPQQAAPEGLFGDAEVYGSRGDRRRRDTLAGTVRIVDDGGREVAAGPVTQNGFFLPIGRSGRFTAQVRFPSFAMDDRIGEATLTTRFETGGGPSTLPAITSFAVLDGTGRHATRLPLLGNGAIVFSAAGYELGAYRRIDTAATKAWFRRRGTEPWTPLTAVATGDEETEDTTDRWPTGLVYRVDLHDALLSGAGEYEVAIEVADDDGNTTRWQLAPAFLVEPRSSSGGKRRAVRP